MANYKEIMDKVRQDRFEQDVAKVDEEYLRRFSDSAGSYLDSAKGQYDGLGYGNAYQTYLNRRDSYNDLDYRRRVIQEWNKRNPGKLDQQSASWLDSFGKDSKGILDAFSGMQKYFSQFDSEEAYKQYLEDAERWSKLTGGYDPDKHRAQGIAAWHRYQAEQEQLALEAKNAMYGKSWKDNLKNYLAQNPNIFNGPSDELPDLAQAYRDWDSDQEKPDKRWSAEQQEIFGYLWSTDPQKADIYARAVNEMLNAQQEAQQRADVQKMASDDFWGGALHTAGAILTAPTGMVDYIGDLVAKSAIGYIPGTDGYVSPFEYSQEVTGGISENLNAKYGTLDKDALWGVLGNKGLGDVYGLGVSAAQSMLYGKLLGKVGTLATFFGSGAASAVDEAKARGASDEQALTFGAISGAAEVLTEMVPLDNLLNMGRAQDLKGLFWDIFKQGGEEFLGEGANSIITSIADYFTFGELSTYNMAKQEYMDKGMSEEEAAKRAFRDIAEDIAFDALGGFVTGTSSAGIMAGVPTAIHNANVKKNYGQFQQELVAEGLESADGTESHELAAKYQLKLDRGKKLTGGQLSRLIDANEQAFREEEKTAQEGTEAPEAATVAENATVSKKEAVADKLLPTDGKTTVAEDTNVPAKTVTRQVSTGKEVTPQKITAIHNGKATIQTDSGEISGDDIEFSTGDMALLWQSAPQFNGITPSGANGVIQAYRSGDSVTAYLAGAGQEFRNGYNNLPSGGKYADKLAPWQRELVYGLGREAAAENIAKAQAKVTAAKQGGAAKNATTGKVHFDRKGRSFDSVREASLKTMEQLSAVMGVEFHVYESYVNKAGERVYRDASGNEVHAPNGFYDTRDGSIHIDLNAGVDGKGTMLFTAAHELTHFIKQWAPEKFKILADYLVEQYGEAGESVNDMVDAQIAKARRGGRDLSWEDAFEEMVADSMEAMLTDGNVVQMMADLKQQDKSLWQKIRDWFRDLAADLKNLVEAYKGVKPDSVEGKMVSQMRDAIQTLESMYAEALTDAGENFRAEISPGEEGVAVNQSGEPVAYATEDGSVMLSMRTYEEDGRKAFRDYLQKCVQNDSLTKAEMQEMLNGIEEIYGICKDFKDKYAPFSAWSDAAVVRDTHGRPVFSVVTPNGDYKMNLDFSLVCKKRRTLDAVFNEMSRRGIIDDFELGQKSVVKINEIIRKYGLETACALCFVDAKRFRQASMADSFTSLYNELVESLVPEDQKGSIDHFNFSGYETIKKVEGGIDTWPASKLDFSHLDHVMKTYGKGTVEHKAAKYIKTHAQGRKLLLRGDFMSSQGFDAVKTQNKDILKLYNSKKGTGGPKAAFGDVQYMNEIIKKARTWTPDKAYAVGGVRIQSFSDYVPRMVFDYAQMIYDLAATKLPAHAYTKEALFVKQFGLTGVKINMSLIPAIAEGGIAPGLDAKGDYVWAGESFDFETAKQIQNAEGYTENCGTICVGVSQAHIEKLLADPDIRMVIPYHKSGLNPIVAHMNKIAAFTDYTDNQRTKGRDGKAIEQDFDFSKAMHDMGDQADPRAVADQYLKWCAAQDYRPRFHMFAHLDGYYKLLEDFTLYDKDGRYVPQREVRAVFPKEGAAFGSMKDLIREGLEEDAVVEGKRDSRLSAIVDEIQKTLPRTEAEIEEKQVQQADRDLEAEVKYSVRGTNQDGIEVYETSEEIKKLSYKERQQRFLDIMANEYRGRTAKFVRNGHAYYATFEGKDVNKNIYGDKRSDKKGWKAKINAGADGDIFELVENAQYDGSKQEKGKKITAHRGVGYWDYFIKNVQIDGTVFDLTANVRKKADGAFVYSIQLNENKKIKASPPRGSLLRASSGVPNASVNNVAQPAQNVKEFSDRDPAQQKVSKVLARENARLKEDVAYLKELLKLQKQVTGGTKFTKSSVDAAAGQLIKSAEAKGKKAELAPVLNNFYEYIAQGHELTWEGVKEAAQPVLDWLQSHARGQDGQKTADGDYGYDQDLHGQELLRQIYDSYWNVTTLYTVADKAQREINRLKSAHAERMAELKQYHAEETARLTQEHREALQRVRQDMQARAEKQRQGILERNEASRQRAAENRKKVAVRAKIRRTVMDLNKLLNKGDKKRNVKEGMQDLVSEALHSADILFTENYTNEDMIRNGVGTDLTEQESKYMQEAREILEQMENLPSGSYEVFADRQETEAQLKSKLGYRMSRLQDVFARERARLNRTRISEVLNSLADAYASLQNSEQSYVSEGYHENVYQYLLMLKGDVGGTTVKDMTLNQLEELHKAYTMVLTTVRNANKMFAENLKQTREQLGNQAIAEVQKAGGEHGLWAPGEDKISAFSWNNEKPVYAFERIGSETLTKLFENTRAGEDGWARDMTEARAFYLDQIRKHKYDSWNFDRQYRFTSSSGVKFSLNLEQIMSLYAYSKREQAHDHLLKGGFVFDSNTEVQVNKMGVKLTYLNKTAKAHNVSQDILADIVSQLTAEQKAFVDEMQEYLSTTMGGKGNEVSLQLYGVKLFNEKHYFPLRSAGQYMERAKEADLKKQQGQISIVNSGFTKATTPKSSNPVVLSGFMDVWADHVNEMSMYHSFVLPMEDFRRVYNYSSPNVEEGQSISVNSVIQDAYGEAATGYIDQLYRDLNGGAVSDPRETPAKALMGKFKKAAVFASLSVVVQQPSAIGRAFAIIDTKYFIGAKVDNKRHKQLWAELKQYAPVATIKEMGYFDTGMGKSAQEFIQAKEYKTLKEKAAALFTDGDYRDEVLGKMPALADELTWCAIWEAVKRETKAKNPGMNVKSEDFLQLAGKRFTEVITKTQVYDSVLSRSANMRSKGAFMSMWTAFMAEPTTTINMVEDALRKAKKGNKQYAARAMGAVMTSVVINSLLASLVYAMRDDDEDETFLEKYVQSVATEILDGVNPITYYPFLKDVWSVMQGYDIERSDMSLITSLVEKITKLVKVYSKDTEAMDEEELAEHNKSLATAWWGVTDYLTALLGIPVKNVRRDINGAFNMFRTISQDLTDRDTSWGSLIDKTWDDVKNSIPVVGWLPDATAADKLYDATVNGDEAYRKRLESAYSSQTSLDNAIRKGLRANDSRIWEAAMAWNNNDLEGYKRLAREIIDEGHFSQDNVVMAIQAEAKAMMPKESESAAAPKAKGFFNMDKFAVAIAQGNANMAAVIKADIIDTAVKNGKSLTEAENSFASSVSSACKDLYLDGTMTQKQAVDALAVYGGYDKERAQVIVGKWRAERETGIAYENIDDAFLDGEITAGDVRNMYMTYGGLTQEKAEEQVVRLSFVKKNPALEDISAAAVRDYTDYCEQAGVKPKVFYDAWKYKNSLSGTVKEPMLEYINGLNLTVEQKDALYFAFGWAASKLGQAPWH